MSKRRRTRAQRSAAARKGWRTRRANERARSERAQRGWITRRENERNRLKAKSKPATRVAVKPKRGGKQIAGQLPSRPQVYEWLVTFTYTRSGRSFDVIVTAHDEDEAEQLAMKYLSHDKGFRKAKGWVDWNIVPSRGRATRRKAGHAEFRSES